MVFFNIQDFVNKFNPLVSIVEREKYPNITNVLDLFNSINKGCGCTRNARLNNALNSYHNLGNILSNEEKAWILEVLNEKEIIFKDEEKILYQISNKNT